MHLVKTLLAAGLLLSATAEAQNVLDFPLAGLSNMKPTPKPAF